MRKADLSKKQKAGGMISSLRIKTLLSKIQLFSDTVLSTSQIVQIYFI